MPLVKKPNVQADYQLIHKRGVEAVNEVLDIALDQHKELVAPWEYSQDIPAFKKEVKVKPGFIIGLIELAAHKAEQATLSVWQLLDRGTKVRYMQVSEEGHYAGKWKSKTKPGSITSGPGAGTTTGLDTDDPKPGISKRDFAENIGDFVEAAADNAIDKAYGKGF
jgi:hypothetical protein